MLIHSIHIFVFIVFFSAHMRNELRYHCSLSSFKNIRKTILFIVIKFWNITMYFLSFFRTIATTKIVTKEISSWKFLLEIKNLTIYGIFFEFFSTERAAEYVSSLSYKLFLFLAIALLIIYMINFMTCFNSKFFGLIIPQTFRFMRMIAATIQLI